MDGTSKTAMDGKSLTLSNLSGLFTGIHQLSLEQLFVATGSDQHRKKQTVNGRDVDIWRTRVRRRLVDNFCRDFNICRPVTCAVYFISAAICTIVYAGGH